MFPFTWNNFIIQPVKIQLVNNLFAIAKIKTIYLKFHSLSIFKFGWNNSSNFFVKISLYQNIDSIRVFESFPPLLLNFLEITFFKLFFVYFQKFSIEICLETKMFFNFFCALVEFEASQDFRSVYCLINLINCLDLEYLITFI